MQRGYQAAPKASAHCHINKALVNVASPNPGVITDHKPDQEPGAAGLRYSCDIIKSGGKPCGVGGDAVAGQVLENAAHGPHPD